MTLPKEQLRELTPLNKFSIAVQELGTDLTDKQFIAIIDLAKQYGLSERLDEHDKLYAAFALNMDIPDWHTHRVVELNQEKEQP